jgi:hypothetical protein
VITVYPGTPYYDNATLQPDGSYCFETHGDKLYSEDVDFTRDQAYYKGKSGEYHAFVWTDFIDRAALARKRDEVEREVRSALGIPYPTEAAAVLYDHSMGAQLPPHILRSAQILDQSPAV